MIIFANLINHYLKTLSFPKGICKWYELYLQLLKHTCFFKYGIRFHRMRMIYYYKPSLVGQIIKDLSIKYNPLDTKKQRKEIRLTSTERFLSLFARISFGAKIQQ